MDYILYHTDKHARNKFTMICLMMAMREIHATDIKDIYVLGHSLGDTDLEYFVYLKEATSGKTTYSETLTTSRLNENNLMDELNRFRISLRHMERIR